MKKNYSSHVNALPPQCIYYITILKKYNSFIQICFLPTILDILIYFFIKYLHLYSSIYQKKVSIFVKKIYNFLFYFVVCELANMNFFIILAYITKYEIDIKNPPNTSLV